MKDVRCPYCGTEQDIDHCDGYGYEEDTLHQQECRVCGKTFAYTTYITFDYKVKRADCLNDGYHSYEPTMTWPVECTRMECTMCGDARVPTAEEWKQIYKIRTL